LLENPLSLFIKYTFLYLFAGKLDGRYRPRGRRMEGRMGDIHNVYIGRKGNTVCILICICTVWTKEERREERE
jgi:hypothetical protein